MLQGLLVDLVPFGDRFKAREHDWRNSEGVFYWATGGRWFETRRGVEEAQQRHLDQWERGEPRMAFGVQTKDGTPIGLFAFNHVHPHHRLLMLSALIGEPDYWGGGYGTDALTLLADFGFEWLDARKLWLKTMSLNERVQRQMQKVGFTLESSEREATWADNDWAGMLTYGLLREEWPGRAAVIERIGLKAR
ncbi:MAG TPA: GNAT family protein [Aggregatilinea sp.]|uniref:GNAT family N-acetyltransferase n=1 Tax=Aggregatilinea sp. TaxID=2806333 RepID=UPI002B86AE3A|nr:GNAT family protein [Aggregatilinea sp.]HML24536.1 GNAT family protein [Aggregatilinea sp.]